MNLQSNQHHPTYRSPFLSPLTPPAAGNGGLGGGGGFGRNNNYNHPYSPSSFRGGSGPHQQQRTPRLYNGGESPTSAAAAATTSTSEWNAQHVHMDLQTAGQLLLQRQLKCSAKFIAELDIGLCLDHHISHDNDDNVEDAPINVEYKSTTIPEHLFFPSHNHDASKIQYPSLFQYARTLVEMGDYAYAATILSVPASSSRTASSSSETEKFASTQTSSLSPTVEITTSSNRSNPHTFPQKPLPNLSSYETYVRSYALYMAGEKQKEEQILEYHRYAVCPFVVADISFLILVKKVDESPHPLIEGQSSMTCRNPYISDLVPALQEANVANRLDAFGLYVYGAVLVAAMATTGYSVHDNHNDVDDESNAPLQSLPSAHSVLIQSILQFPYNWSAWLDLASLLIGTSASTTSSVTLSTATTAMIEQDIEEKIQPLLGGHYMYNIFCAHVFVERHNYYDAMIIYEQLMDINMFSAAPYIRSQYAMCCYHMRDFVTAKLLLQELHITIPYRLDAMDVYSNVLYVLEDSFALSQLAHVAVLVDKHRAETCCIIGNYYSMKKQRAKAIQHFQRALLLDRTFTSAYTLIGHEYVEWKQTANAMESYRKAVQISPRDYRAWYGLGQTYELLNMNLHALYYYKQATQLRPYDALMWCALGSTFSQIQRPQDAIKAYERALQQNPQEHFATQKLATLYHNNHRSEDAAQCYMRHLELRYSSMHPNDNSESNLYSDTSKHDINAATMNRLEKILQGIAIETIEAEAIMYLAIYYHEHDDFDSAAIFCSRLLDYPGPEREQAKGMLRELRSRKLKSTEDPTTTHDKGIHTRSKGPIKDKHSMAFNP